MPRRVKTGDLVKDESKAAEPAPWKLVLEPPAAPPAANAAATALHAPDPAADSIVDPSAAAGEEALKEGGGGVLSRLLRRVEVTAAEEVERQIAALRDMKLLPLRRRCRERGPSTEGDKEVLRRRLEDYMPSDLALSTRDDDDDD